MFNPIDRAQNGDSEFFKRLPEDQILNARDPANHSALSVAIWRNHIHCSRVILKRCPSLLYLQDKDGNTTLHHAAWGGKPALVKLLIHGAEEKLYRMCDDKGNAPIIDAVTRQNFEAVKLLIQADPDYEYPVNNSGENMLLIALKLSYGKTSDEVSVKIRRLLLEKQPSQCKVRTRANGWTSLHHATSKGDLCAIQDIIQFCPDCMDLVDQKGQNFLHIAVQYQHVEVVEYIVGEKEMAANLLNNKNNEGNTPLDIAAKIGNRKIISCLQYGLRNVQDPTTAGYDNEREKVLCIPPKYLEVYRKSVRHFGEIVPPDQSPLLDEFLSIVSDMMDVTPDTLTQEKIMFWEEKVVYYIGVGLHVSWLQNHVTQLCDWLEKKNEKEKELASLRAELEQFASKFGFRLFKE